MLTMKKNVPNNLPQHLSPPPNLLYVAEVISQKYNTQKAKPLLYRSMQIIYIDTHVHASHTNRYTNNKSFLEINNVNNHNKAKDIYLHSK